MYKTGGNGCATSKLWDDDSSVGAIVIDVGCRHPYTGQPWAVALLDVIWLQEREPAENTWPEIFD